MATIAELREKLPELRGLDDETAVRYVQRVYYPSRSPDEVASALGYKAPPPPAQPRGMAAAVNDTVIDFANAAAGGVSAAGNFIAPGNPVSGYIDKNIIEAGKASQSDATRAEDARYQQEMQGASGLTEEALATLAYAARNPVRSIATAAGSFVGPGVAVKGARGIAGALGAGERGMTRAGMAGGAAVGSAMAGGDAAGTAYELSIKAGATHEQAVDAARQASVIPAVIGGAGGLVGAERLLAGGKGFAGGRMAQGLKTGLVEAGQEGVEEGVTQYEGQRAAMPFDPTIDPMKGVGGAATMGAVLGGITGGGIAALTHRPGDELRTAKFTGKGPMQNAVNEGIIEPAAKKVDAGAPLPPEPPIATAPATGQMAPADPNATGSVGQGQGAAPVAPVQPADQMPAPVAIDAPVLDPAVQREADKPPEPTGETLPGEKVIRGGDKQQVMARAMRELERKGPDFEIVRVTEGLVVRKKPGAVEPVATQDSTPEIQPNPVDAEPRPAALDDITALKRQWSDAVQRGDAEAVKSLSEQINQAKKRLQNPAPIDTSPAPVEKAPENVQVAKPEAELPMGQEQGGKARVVRVNGQEFTLTPDQRTEMERVEAAFKVQFDDAKAQYERTRNNPPPENPDVGIRSAKERWDAEQKALGMKLSAERRRIVGAQTPKERAKQVESDNRVRPGDTVQTHEGIATVTGLNFGRVRVQVNGQTRTFNRADVTKTDAAVHPTTEAKADQAPVAADAGGTTAAQAVVPGAADAAVEADGVNELVKVRTIFGTNTYVRKKDMDGPPGLVRMLTKEGKNNGRIQRENLDPTGEKLAAIAAEDATNPLFNVITRKGGGTFASEAAATREINARGLQATHEVVSASAITEGVDGFAIRRRPQEAATPPAPEATSGANDGKEAEAQQDQGRRQEEGLLTKGESDTKPDSPDRPTALIELRKRLSVLKSLKGCLKS